MVKHIWWAASGSRCYEPAIGAPKQGIPPDTPFESLPDTFFADESRITGEPDPKLKFWRVQEQFSIGRGETWICNKCGRIYEPNFGVPGFCYDEVDYGEPSYDEIFPATPYEDLAQISQPAHVCRNSGHVYSRRIFGKDVSSDAPILEHPFPRLIKRPQELLRGDIPLHVHHCHQPIFSIAVAAKKGMLAVGTRTSASMLNFKRGPNGFLPDSRFGKVLRDETLLWSTMESKYRPPKTSVSFSPDDLLVATTSWDGTVELFKTTRKMGFAVPVCKFELGNAFNDYFETSSFYSASFSPDGKYLAAGSYGTVIIDVSKRAERIYYGERGQKLDRQEIFMELNYVYGLSFSPESKSIALAGKDGKAGIWDLGTAEQVIELVGHKEDVRGIAFSPDGKLIATCCLDRSVRLWDVRNGDLIRTLVGHEGAVCSIAFSPDGRLLATGSTDWTARIWDVASGSVKHVYDAHYGTVHAVSFFPDGTILATGGADKDILFWNLTNLC